MFALLASYRERLIVTSFQYGCPIGRLALELDPENIPAHDLIARNFDAWKAAVEASLRAAGVVSPGDAAVFVLTVMEGAVMQSRSHRSVEPFDACVRQLRIHLDTLARRLRAGRSRARRRH